MLCKNTRTQKRITRWTVILLAIFFLSGVVATGMGAAHEQSEKVDVLIGFHEEPNPGLVRVFGGDIHKEFIIVDVIGATMPQQAALALSGHPQVSYVVPNGPVDAHGQTVPWGIERVFGEELYSFDTWNTTKGYGIAVAILDTGIDESHEDLHVLGGVQIISSGEYQINCTHGGTDVNGHGTHVAGTVAALDNEIGVVGIGPDIGLYAVKVLGDDGRGTVSSVVAGIEWAVQQEIPIVSMSLGTSIHNQALKDACDAAYAAGHLLVSSAGNTGHSSGQGDNVGYPAAYDSVIAVAASDSSNSRASFSSTGPAVELIAPGVWVYSTMPDNNYGYKHGTSMAAPHVTGAAALVWAADPGLTNIEVREILQNTAEDLGLSSEHQGYGLVRADLAVRMALLIEPPAVPVAFTDVPEQLSMQPGDEEEITYTVDPEEATVTFASDDTSVVTVDSAGKVTAVGEGSATITLTGTYPDYEDGTATVPVTVTAPPAPAVPVAFTDVPEQLSMQAGDEEEITYTVDPEEATVTFASDDTSVVTVDSAGKVTAVGEGSATITLTGTYPDYEDGTATVPVTVTAPPAPAVPVAFTDVPEQLSMQAGDEEEITYTVDPEEATVTFASDDTSVVTVDSAGKVTAVGKGSAIITLTGTYPDYEDGTATVPVTVTVPPPPAVPVAFTDVPEQLSMQPGDEEEITYTVDPEEATVTFASDDTSVVTVDSAGKVTAVGEGSATITLTGTYPDYEDGTATVPVTVAAPPAKLSINVDEWWTQGGRDDDRHLRFRLLAMADDDRASDVTISLTLNLIGGNTWSFSGTTDRQGEVAFSLNNHPSGSYVLTVNTVSHKTLIWDDNQPENNTYTKK